ncbi:MAG: ADP-forming succinate--CoA ligase subunit beta, partial [Rhodospirillaceae bacterium]
MNIHEYQGKQVLAKYGVAVPRGHVAFTPDEAAKAAEELGGDLFVVKSQIHAGGRGAGRFKDNPDGKGGVRVVKSVDEVRANAAEMLNHVLVTKQTGPDGKEVKRLYIEEGCDIARELYMGMLLDRESSRLLIMASTEGGMEIEEVAAKTPEKILKITVDPATGIQPFHARELAYGLGLEGDQVKSAVRLILSLYKAFIDLDCSMVEINPLVVTGAGQVIALDAKVGFDDNALYRHKDVAEMRDETEEDPAELEAGKWELNYVKLDGEIGCMVNGAGLAMA